MKPCKTKLIFPILVLIFFSILLFGCSEHTKSRTDRESSTDMDSPADADSPTDTDSPADMKSLTDMNFPADTESPTAPYAENVTDASPVVITADWSSYFGDLNGCAVFFDTASRQYHIYNEDLSTVRRSPCSTFKIISSLIGLEQGIILPDSSLRAWSGEMFWNQDWNRDIDFKDAFRTSCVWYFRQIIDEIGPDIMQRELERLNYGNHDCSDWQGTLNTNNQNPSLTGFWIESSLQISPMEQAAVMEKIFGPDTIYKPETLQQLKEVMKITEEDAKEQAIFGKTGTGKDKGVTVDSWFTGFIEKEEGNIYFCVYLGKADSPEVSSAKAKEIALSIAAEYDT